MTTRSKFEYVKAVTMGTLAVLTVVAITIGGGPQAYSPGVVILPIAFGLLTVYFCWKASLFRRESE